LVTILLLIITGMIAINHIAQYTINKNTDAVLFDLPNGNVTFIYKITGLAGGAVNGKLITVTR
jgi:hypothetical protein